MFSSSLQSILPYARPKSITNCGGLVIFEAIVSRRIWKDGASNSSCNPFFNRLERLKDVDVVPGINKGAHPWNPARTAIIYHGRRPGVCATTEKKEQ
jgi:hypothetical protein